MKFLAACGRLFAKPIALWSLFVIVMLFAIGGLALLSRHALELSQQQQDSQSREEQLQNLRISLWRLDSRLGPYIATLHDPGLKGNFYGEQHQFVIQRFLVQREIAGKGSSYRYTPVSGLESMMGMGMSAVPEHQAPNRNRLAQTVPVKDVVAAVEQLMPDLPPVILGNRIIQSYAVPPQQQSSIPPSQRELIRRGGVVQEQFSYNVENTSKGIMESGSEPDDAPVNSNLLPLWINDELLVLRSSRSIAGQLEGVWLDWPALRDSLAEDVIDLLPDAQFDPVRKGDTVDPERTLAAIPAMVVPGALAENIHSWSPTHTALSFAWIALLGAGLIAAFALSRLIALSERRASFVSAVTHELRTPLTTFRLYSDLLARNMVEDPKDRQEYLQTLRREADRLTHLVDNVLRYSKLQGTSKRAALESILLSDWIDRITPRLSARLSSADMELVVEMQQDGHWNTDPPAMEQLLFNLVDNAAKYAKEAEDGRVHLVVSMDTSNVIFRVCDHGPGVPAEWQSTIFRPFAKSAERAAETAAGVGLGLALVRQTAIALGGKTHYEATPGGGACFQVTLPNSATSN